MKVPLASVPPSEASLATAPSASFQPASQASPATVPSASSQPASQASTIFRPGGVNSKRYGHEAPSFKDWYEIYMQERWSDETIGVLLDLSFFEVGQLKSFIHQMLRRPVRPVLFESTSIYHLHGVPSQDRLSLRPELIHKQEDTLLQWHMLPSRTTTLLRSCVVFEVSIEFPQLFKEPATIQEFEKEWYPHEHGYYVVVPYAFRREILIKLVEHCAEEMKNDIYLRTAESDPVPYRKRPASSFENDETSSKRPRIDEASTSGQSDEHPGPSNWKGKQRAT